MNARSGSATVPGQLLVAALPDAAAAPVRRPTAHARARRHSRAMSERLVGPAITAACMLAFAATALVALLLEAPRSLPGATVVTATQARQLVLDGAALVDAREALAFARERIEGAGRLPDRGGSVAAAASAPDARRLSLAVASHGLDTPLVVYGDDAWRSHDVAQEAVRTGHRRVHWMRGGLPEWRANGYPVSRGPGQGDEP